VLGVDTVLASGERTRCGARVVKNVTGYDLAKLYVGSLGTLAVIEKAWLRLKPIPACVRVVEVELEEVDDAFGRALAASRRSSARAVGLIGEPAPDAAARPGPWRLVAEFAGEQPTVRADAEWLAQGRGQGSASAGNIDELRERQGTRSSEGLHARIHLLPAALASVAQRLRARRAHLVVYPEPAVIHAHFEPDEGSLGSAWADGVLGLLEEIGGQGPAEVVIEAMPADARPGRDVFAGASGLDLMRAIKRRFDPEGILNPGRFAGWI
jgi:glycolate oxidase FAD binding subunit